MAASGHRRALGGAYELLRLSNQINTLRTIPSNTRHGRRHPPPPPPAPAPAPAPRQSDRVTLEPPTPPIEPIPAPPPPPAAPPISIPEPEPVAAVPRDLPEPALLLPEEQTATPYNGSVSKVPSSKFGRLLHYGGTFSPHSRRRPIERADDERLTESWRIAGLAASLGWGMASEAVSRRPSAAPAAQGDASSATPQRRSLLMSEANLERLVSKLGKMRGAALKLGQFMSIQGTSRDLKLRPLFFHGPVLLS